MNGRSQALNNLFVGWVLRTVKYQDVCVRDCVDRWQAENPLGKYFDFYPDERPHQALGYRTPSDVYAEG
jgi:putative transposase